jgi:hypothetical protein
MLSVANKSIMLSVILLNVVLLRVVSPLLMLGHNKLKLFGKLGWERLEVPNTTAYWVLRIF